MAETVIYLAVALVMIICTIADIKRKEVSVWLFVLLGITTIIGCILCGEQRGYMIVAGVVPGILLVILAKITEQSIGYGDGIILAEIGLITGVGKCMLILAAALAMAGIFSLAIVVIKKVDKRHKIPFVPFMTAAYMAVFCLQNGGRI